MTKEERIRRLMLLITANALCIPNQTMELKFENESDAILAMHYAREAMESFEKWIPPKK